MTMHAQQSGVRAQRDRRRAVDRYEERIQLSRRRGAADGRLLRPDLVGRAGRLPERQLSRPTSRPMPPMTRGWRDFSSSSQLRRMYVDLGAKGDQTEFHVSFTGADNHLGAVAATPLELLNQRWSSVYTWPQNTHLQLAFLQANAQLEADRRVLARGQQLFPRLLAVPCRRQRHPGSAVRSDLAVSSASATARPRSIRTSRRAANTLAAKCLPGRDRPQLRPRANSYRRLAAGDQHRRRCSTTTIMSSSA